MTLERLLRGSVQKLAQSGVEEPEQEARQLLFHFMGLRLTDYLLRKGEEADPAALEAFQAGLVRRCGREPLQHIIGTAPFMGLDFEVNGDVLIPRADTEVLGERAVALLKELRAGGRSKDISPTEESRRECYGRTTSLSVNKNEEAGFSLITGREKELEKAGREAGETRETREIAGVSLGRTTAYRRLQVLELCTGSGCLAVSLKKFLPEIECWATDLSEKALTVAKRNSEVHGTEIRFMQGDLYDALQDSPATGTGADGERSCVPAHFDLILSNPPYIPSAVIETLAPEVKDHDPRLALDGGADGLDIYRRLIAGAPVHLKDGGYLCLEIGYDQAEAVRGLLEQAGFADIHVTKDLAGLDRVVEGRRRKRQRDEKSVIYT